jgi:hypothetical protein
LLKSSFNSVERTTNDYLSNGVGTPSQFIAISALIIMVLGSDLVDGWHICHFQTSRAPRSC